MDTRDVALLSALFRQPRAGYAELGARLGLSANAVKARVRRLGAEGVLQGFAVTPAPELLGMGEGLLVFTDVQDIAEREEDILRNLPDAPGVRFVDVGIDGTVLVWAYARDAADWERVERAAVSVVGKAPSRAAFRPCPASLEAAPTEWRLIRALLPDGRATLGDLARRSGLSAKTVKRRLASLLRAGSIRVEPVLSPSEASGLVLFSMHVQMKPEGRIEDVLRVLPPDAIAQTGVDPTRVTFHVARATQREAQADHRAVRRVAGVGSVVFVIATRRRADAWLDDAVVARSAGVPVARPDPVPVPVPRR